jgi:hypothetical protein
VKFLKFLLALLLLPTLTSLGRLGCFMILQTSVQNWPWKEVISFSLGFSTCCFAYLTLPKGNWFYVLGHETTHAFAVLLSGGRVSGFKVSSHGGHVISDRNSVWIALSPYFIPFYPIVISLVWALVLFIRTDLTAFTWAFLLLWGFSWGFHLCHTLSLLKTEQPDFESQGYFFSLVLIALMNLLIAEILLWIWWHPLPLDKILSLLQTYLGQDYLFVVQLVKSIVSVILQT